MGQVRRGSATIEPARRHRFEPAGEGTLSEQQYSDRKSKACPPSVRGRD